MPKQKRRKLSDNYRDSFSSGRELWGKRKGRISLDTWNSLTTGAPDESLCRMVDDRPEVRPRLNDRFIGIDAERPVTPERRLLMAAIIQAMQDCELVEFCDDAQRFLASPEFAWACDEIGWGEQRIEKIRAYAQAWKTDAGSQPRMYQRVLVNRQAERLRLGKNLRGKTTPYTVQ